ncbi:hypothetical protein L3X38_026731 [Prunus dulcis]|uniref:Uncharacterized protein n=1 Tax=Prunus dulcis TaxID=3755 RepID=A0AAD4VLL6_PRUDU|nr:hypothetical protein L3X38_026731 [Prunus dulcis]
MEKSKVGRRIVAASLSQGHPTYVLQRPEIGLDIDKVQILLAFKKQGAHLVEGSFLLMLSSAPYLGYIWYLCKLPKFLYLSFVGKISIQSTSSKTCLNDSCCKVNNVDPKMASPTSQLIEEY